MQKKKDYYVYAHLDKETKVPFYIGKGRGKRAFSKKRDDYWLRFVSEVLNHNYDVVFLAKDIDEITAYEVEGAFIEKYGNIHNGSGTLVNWTPGGLGEGVVFSLEINTEEGDLSCCLTDLGKYLWETSFDDYLGKTNVFLITILNEEAEKIANRILTHIQKKGNPQKPWFVPFFITEDVPENAVVKVRAKTVNAIKQEFSNKIQLDKLPQRPYVDFYLHRLWMHFDLQLQDWIWLEDKGKRISAPNTDWHFYKSYWEPYLKVIQYLNNGMQLNARLIRTNNYNNTNNAIKDFQVWKE